MEVSSLPPFPAPEPLPTAMPPTSAGRGTTMLLQLLFLLAFWPAVYVIHEQATAMVAAERKAREREPAARDEEAAIQLIAGRWASTHGDDAIIVFGETRHTPLYTVLNNHGSLLRGSVRNDGFAYVLRVSEYGEDCRVRVDGDELAIEFGEFGQRYFVELRGLPWNGVWRFKRLKE